MAHVSQLKKDIVKELLANIEKYKIIGAVNLDGLPSKQLQNMRASLRSDDVKVIMTKRRIIKIALEESKKEGVKELIPYLKGMPALIFTNDNPFKLFKQLEKSKSSAPAKAGQVAPVDVVVKAGPTSFAPGPIIGELGGVGIKAGINAGKVEIKQESVVLKEGETFTAQLAGILSRLEVFPMEIGLALTAACEDGLIYDKKVLAVDEQEYIDNVTNCATWALNLSVEAGVYNKDNIDILIGKSSTESTNLAMEATIYADTVMDQIVGKAHNHMLGVSSGLPDEALSDDLRNSKQSAAAAPVVEAAKEEDKKEEPKDDGNSEEAAAAGMGALFG